MSTLKPIVFGTLVLAALSVTQMDAFARGREGPRPHFEHQEVPHTTNNPGARPSGPATSETQVSRPRGPEVVVPDGEISGEVVVPEGGTTVTLPGSNDRLKTETSCTHNPNDPTCVK
jgi:hypothetical protein